MGMRLGVDLGGTAIKTGIVDDEYRILYRHSRPTESRRGFAAVMKNIGEAAREVAEMAGMKISDFACVGVGTPSCINPNTGRLVFSNNTNWKDMPFREELSKHIPVPIFVGNDANCAIAGETIAGAAAGHKHVLMLTLGTGVGGGVVSNGKLYLGGDGMGTELGHTPLIAGGIRCTCGIRGCLESYASVTALIRQTKEAMERHPESSMHEFALQEGCVSGLTAFECAKHGDTAAQEVVDTYIGYLANGIGGLINIFRPEVVLLGGGLSAQGDALTGPVMERLPEFVFASDVIGVPPVRKALLGNDAGTIGAAFLSEM